MELLNTISTSLIWTRHGIKIAYGVTAAFLLVSIGSIAWNIRSQNQIKAANYAEQSIAPIRNKPAHTYRVNDIVNANLFGNPNPAPVAKIAPKTTLDLTLEGILSANDHSMARAIIMSGKRSAKIYSIGDSIQSAGVSIKEIKANEVLLNRNGAIESLPLKKLKGSRGDSNSIISYSGGSGQISQPSLQTASVRSSQINRSSRKPRSENGQPRKIKKPNFSGLDRALQKMGEI